MIELRRSRDPREVDAWMLALTSQAIASERERIPEGWALGVAQADALQAAEVLAAWDRDSAERPAPPPIPIPEWGRTGAGFAMAALLLASYALTGSPQARVPWLERGSASAAAILAGEVWRAVTALFLHVNLAHVLSNAVFIALFGTAVCRVLGPGVGCCLVLLAGALGNAANAAFHGAGHDSVGASSAVFGAIGILGSLQLARGSRARRARRPIWFPVAAALALLAMLGMDPRSDVLAHIFGLLSGLALGAAAGAALARPPGALAQGLALALAAGAILASWRLALV